MLEKVHQIWAWSKILNWTNNGKIHSWNQTEGWIFVCWQWSYSNKRLKLRNVIYCVSSYCICFFFCFLFDFFFFHFIIVISLDSRRTGLSELKFFMLNFFSPLSLHGFRLLFMDNLVFKCDLFSWKNYN